MDKLRAAPGRGTCADPTVLGPLAALGERTEARCRGEAGRPPGSCCPRETPPGPAPSWGVSPRVPRPGCLLRGHTAHPLLPRSLWLKGHLPSQTPPGHLYAHTALGARRRCPTANEDGLAGKSPLCLYPAHSTQWALPKCTLVVRHPSFLPRARHPSPAPPCPIGRRPQCLHGPVLTSPSQLPSEPGAAVTPLRGWEN